MPGLTPIVGDIIETQVLTSFGNQIGLNVLHYRVATVVSGGTTLAAAAAVLDLGLHAAYKNAICNQATYRGIGMTNLAAPRSVQTVSQGNLGVGTGGANMSPTQVRGLISWYSNLAGRRYRGRTYIPFVPTNGVTAAGDPLAAYVTIMDAVRAVLQGGFTVTSGAPSTTYVLAIIHRNDNPLSASDVVLGVTRNRFATQRRSGAYGRANTPPF